MQCLDYPGTRVVTGIVPAHSIGDRPQAKIGAVQESILVTFANSADMGQRVGEETVRLTVKLHLFIPIGWASTCHIRASLRTARHQGDEIILRR